MCATSSSPRQGRRRCPPRGFTLVELLVVVLMAGVLAVVVVPRLDLSLGLRGAAWRDQLVAAAHTARSVSNGHRRLVCMVVATGEVRLGVASANPATSCDGTLSGPDGDARWAVDPHQLAVTLSPAGTLYFQPDGRITSDGAGTSAVNATLTVTGEAAVQLTGETGHVR